MPNMCTASATNIHQEIN